LTVARVLIATAGVPRLTNGGVRGRSGCLRVRPRQNAAATAAPV